jgi:LuxR family maltose regulon positive regulatory protein
LIERLNEGLCQNQDFGPKLTLISAPAGFGKTTLVSEWAIGCDRKVAWLSLDEADSDPIRFLIYFVAAIRTVAPDIGEELLRALQDPQPLAVEGILTALLNEIATISVDIVLVLDDYHLIDAKAIDDAITFLIEHLPPQMRLVITTREDPHLPLARLRARGQLTELRATDLRFTPSEAAGFLQTMSLNLSPEDIQTLETRTEGWIAGLQLAAIALRSLIAAPTQPPSQGRQDAPGFIRAFAGDHRYIMDYLVEEVLQHQPASVRSFLLQTAILDQLSGPLCAAVTGQEDSHSRLEALERGNFFIIPLDDQRRWYRYHHLFAQVLYAHLLAEQPDLISVLHRRASEWYEQQGSTPDAIRHALADKDFERAARLVEMAAPAMHKSRQEAALLGWFRALPEELLRFRPVLSNGYAGALLACGELDGVEARLQLAEQWVDMSTSRMPPPEARPAEVVVFNEDEFRHLPASIAVHRTGLTMLLGDVAGAIQSARQALELTAEDDHLSIGGAMALLGLAYWAIGDLEAAHRTYAAGMVSVQKAGHISDGVASAITLADIRIAQGRLREAMSTYEWGLKLATQPGAPILRGAADMYVGISELLRECNDRNAAMQYLLRCNQLGEHNGFPQNPYRRRVAMARLREAEGDLDGALDLLNEAERLYAGDFSPNVRPVPALKTRVWIAQGRLDEALDWVRGQGLSAHDNLSYLHEFEHITLVRVLLALYQRDRAGSIKVEAIELLGRLLKAAEEGERAGSVIEILILQALAHQMQGNLPAALVPLECALRQAEPEGYVRIFVDEGQPMLHLLLEAADRGIMPGYTQKLLAALTAEQQSDELPAASTRAHSAAQPLIEPLSQRELEILRLFKTELSGPEIAQQLVIALSTVRTHTKSIYGKLNVNNRRAAVIRAEELDLI